MFAQLECGWFGPMQIARRGRQGRVGVDEKVDGPTEVTVRVFAPAGGHGGRSARAVGAVGRPGRSAPAGRRQAALAGHFKTNLKRYILTNFGGAGVVPIDSSRKIRPGHGVKIGF